MQIVQQPKEQTFRGSLQRFVRHAGLKARVAAEFRTLECVSRARHSSPVPQCWNGGFAPSAGFLPPSPRPPGAAVPEARPSSDQPECKLETDEVLKLFVLMGTPAAFLGRAKKMFGHDEPEEKSAAKEGQSTKAADDARARAGAATVADTGHGKKSSASEPSAAACGPFAPPKLVPGRLGFGQFAASSARPFKLNSKPSASNAASGKKKVS